VIVVVVFAVAFGGTFYMGNQYGQNVKELEQTKAAVALLEDSAARELELRKSLETERERLRKVSEDLQNSLENKEVVYEEVIRTVVEEVEKPVYSDVAMPASGVLALSE